ncbi:THUMP domain-containing protein 2, partial [Eudyptes schlegeli]
RGGGPVPPGPQPALRTAGRAKMAAGGWRYFCTAGRGLEVFLAREVRARLGATEVRGEPAPVPARGGPGKRLHCRLFLLLKKQPPLAVSRNKGKMLHEIKSLVTEEPKYWLDVISIWRNLRGSEGKKDDVSQENRLPPKRKSEEETNIATKRQKTEQVREPVPGECQVEAGERCVVPERKSDQDCRTESKTSLEDPSKSSREKPIANEQLRFSFRVSCRCSGAIAKILPSQEIGRALGIALMKQFGWRADLRDPDLEVVVLVCQVASSGLPYQPEKLLLPWEAVPLQTSGGSCNPKTGFEGDPLLSPWKSTKSGKKNPGSIFPANTNGKNSRAMTLDVFRCFIERTWHLKCQQCRVLHGRMNARQDEHLTFIFPAIARVLRVGGTIVLLLSQDLRKRMDGITKSAESASPNAISDGANETATAKALIVDGNSSSLGNGVEESFPSSRQRRFGSLVPDGVYGVSLGKTDAFIYKYRKISTAGNQ